MNQFPFTIEKTDGGARAARLVTPHGTVQTPVFMPVGTQGAIRSLTPHHLSETGSQIILANTQSEVMIVMEILVNLMLECMHLEVLYLN